MGTVQLLNVQTNNDYSFIWLLARCVVLFSVHTSFPINGQFFLTIKDYSRSH